VAAKLPREFKSCAIWNTGIVVEIGSILEGKAKKDVGGFGRRSADGASRRSIST